VSDYTFADNYIWLSTATGFYTKVKKLKDYYGNKDGVLMKLER
jgi:hypothetical protein